MFWHFNKECSFCTSLGWSEADLTSMPSPGSAPTPLPEQITWWSLSFLLSPNPINYGDINLVTVNAGPTRPTLSTNAVTFLFILTVLAEGSPFCQPMLNVDGVRALRGTDQRRLYLLVSPLQLAQGRVHGGAVIFLAMEVATELVTGQRAGWTYQQSLLLRGRWRFPEGQARDTQSGSPAKTQGVFLTDCACSPGVTMRASLS